MSVLDLPVRGGDSLRVLEVTGSLDLRTAEAFEAEVFGMLDRSSVLVDLARLEFLAVSSLRSLLLCHRYAQLRGRQLGFVSARSHVRRLLRLSRVDTVVEVFDSLDGTEELRRIVGARARLWPSQSGRPGVDLPPVGPVPPTGQRRRTH